VIMKLTEAKLKQMILEAIKNKRLQDFGIPTPDEKLKSKLGDENFDKIQSLDKNQADVMKQTFDPDYPRDLKQETIQSFMESLGYDLEIQEVEYIGRPNDIFMNELYLHSGSPKVFSIDYSIKTFDSLPNKKYIYFNYSYTDNRGTTRKNGSIELSNMFDLSMGDYYYPNEEDIETMSSLIIGRIKNDLKKMIGTK
jgi:hypothetical protein